MLTHTHTNKQTDPTTLQQTHSYLVAVGGRSLYVAFMGTKQARDISTDLAFAQEAVWVAAEQQQQQQQRQSAGAPEVRVCVLVLCLYTAGYCWRAFSRSAASSFPHLARGSFRALLTPLLPTLAHPMRAHMTKQHQTLTSPQTMLDV